MLSIICSGAIYRSHCTIEQFFFGGMGDGGEGTGREGGGVQG